MTHCKDEKCEGKVPETPVTELQTGCTSFTSAFACELCGLLHGPHGSPFYNRGTEKMAYWKGGRVVYRSYGIVPRRKRAELDRR